MDLFDAVRKADSAKVRHLLAARRARRGVNAKDSNGTTALMHAARNRDAGIVGLLLSAGAEINARDREGWTALMHAVEAVGNTEVVRTLLAAGADLDAEDNDGQTALSLAAFYTHNTEVVAMLKEAGAEDPNESNRALLEAARQGEGERVRQILEAGCDVNFRQRGYTPLSAAIGSGQAEIVLDVLAAGANLVTSRDKHGTMRPPLIQAVAADCTDIVGLLLDAGADPNEREEWGERSALLHAGANGNREIVEMLVAAGAGKDREAQDFLACLQFAEAAEQPAFRQAVQELEALTGRPATPIDHPRLRGAVCFHILATEEAKALHESGQEEYKFFAEWRAAYEKIERLLDAVQDDFRRRGFSAFDMGRAGVCADGRILGLMPTDDKYVVLAAMGTNCKDGENGPAEVIRWFRKLEEEHPFVLRGCCHDTVDVIFMEPIRDARALAKRMYRFCPDMVQQGTGTLDALIEELKKTQRAHFWWD